MPVVLRATGAAAAAAAALLSAGRLTAAKPDRLRIVNGCESEALWIAHMAAGSMGPDLQDIKIEPLDFHDFQTPDGLSATRYWPKMGCDAEGNNCGIGDSGGPGEGCVRRGGGWDDYSQCAPPVDTKFEASFGQNGQPCNPQTPGGVEMKGCDYVDISLVDGFTLPVKLEIYGDCKDSRNGGVVDKIDCTGLSLDACPTGEDLRAAGTLDLQAVHPQTGRVSGCYSPCMRLLDTKWANQEQAMAEDAHVAPYCCPTPPVSPEACRAGPVTRTQFLQVVQEKCPGAYGYAYDDKNGLLRCSSDTQYVLIYFCPSERQAPGANALSNRSQAFLRP